MKRRDIIRQLSVFPFAGGALATNSLDLDRTSRMITEQKFGRSDKNIYESIGVDTIINCRGTFTILGGSIELPEVIEAMEAASGNFVQYDELAYGIGKRLAELTQTQWGMVSSGCAAGLKHVTAACVTGGNPEKLIRIPDLRGFEKYEVIAPRTSRNMYDHAVRNVGVKMITVETPEEMQRAINKHTAMIYLVLGRHTEKGEPLSLEAVAEIAKPHNIPILADAAAEDLTIPPIHLERGATIVAYSGGKAIRGPQCAGLLLGDKDILMAAWQASSPHHGPGRDNKVGKEEMLGMLAAVEAWTRRDHDQIWQQWLGWLDLIAKKVESINGIKTEVREPEGLSNHAPSLHIWWDPGAFNLTGFDVAEELGRNKPRVAVGDRDRDGLTSVNITPNQMQEGEAEIVANRLHAFLSKKHAPKPKPAAPKVNLQGHWQTEVSFFNGTSTHLLFLEQDGNWLQGKHQTDFEILDLVGMIEADEIKMRSRFYKPGNHLLYLFTGKATGDEITGSIFLGEYLTAQFKATRIKRDEKRTPILVPGGPPLAT